ACLKFTSSSPWIARSALCASNSPSGVMPSIPRCTSMNSGMPSSFIRAVTLEPDYPVRGDRSRPTGRSELEHRLALHVLVLLGRDLPLVTKLRALRDLGGGGVALDASLRLLSLLEHLPVLRRHLGPRDHVDQGTQERHD